MREADPDDPTSTKARLVVVGGPNQLTGEIAAAHDETMSQCILDFYRSAIPNLAADWWGQPGPTASRGLVLLLPNPPQDEAMSADVASRLGATTARLDDLNPLLDGRGPTTRRRNVELILGDTRNTDCRPLLEPTAPSTAVRKTVALDEQRHSSPTASPDLGRRRCFAWIPLRRGRGLVGRRKDLVARDQPVAHLEHGSNVHRVEKLIRCDLAVAHD
jgi:hypothetical protein